MPPATRWPRHVGFDRFPPVTKREAHNIPPTHTRLIQLDDVLGGAESGLECLALQDLDGARANPVVHEAGYAESARRRFCNLRKLDGRRLHGEAAGFYEECVAFESTGHRSMHAVGY